MLLIDIAFPDFYVLIDFHLFNFSEVLQMIKQN